MLSSLEGCGYAVESIAAVDHYIQTLEASSPDLALLPLTVDGEHLLNTIVGMENHPPVLVYGDAADTELAGQFMQAGAHEYFLSDYSDNASSTLLGQLAGRTIDAHKQLTELRDQTAVLKREAAVLKGEAAVLKGEAAALQDKLGYLARDQHAAFDMQQKLLPDPQHFGDIWYAYHLVPRSGLSGDAVNCFELEDGRLLFYLADVAGHGALGGVIATALTVTAKSLSNHDFGKSTASSSDLLVWFNRALLALHLERHVAMFLGVISADRSSIQYSSAAHFPGTILCQDDVCCYLELGGLPLGICETDYECQEAPLSENFELLLFSDGVLEILPHDSIENREKYLISLVESGARNIGALLHELRLKGRSEVPDDIAILTIHKDSSKETLTT